MKVAHVVLKQRPPSKLLKAQLSGIFQGIFSPAPIPGDCVCQSVSVSCWCAAGQPACSNTGSLGERVELESDTGQASDHAHSLAICHPHPSIHLQNPTIPYREH